MSALLWLVGYFVVGFAGAVWLEKAEHSTEEELLLSTVVFWPIVGVLMAGMGVVKLVRWTARRLP